MDGEQEKEQLEETIKKLEEAIAIMHSRALDEFLELEAHLHPGG